MKRMPFHTTALLRRFAAGFFLVAGMLSCSAPQATFTNPRRDGADPWITKYDGRYYTCFKSGRGIAVTESDDMTRFERERVVWQPADSGAWNSFNIWALKLVNVVPKSIMIGLTPSVAVYFTAATGASGSTVAPLKVTVISKALPVSPLKFTKFTVNPTVLPAAFSVEVNDIVLPSIVTPANSNALADFGVK